ncbi:MAG TPA: S9 family peptidase [Steroidobacteraceae bacterium]|nr:S9 family peptidase [Steroidobacteraceae bacterium]
MTSRLGASIIVPVFAGVWLWAVVGRAQAALPPASAFSRLPAMSLVRLSPGGQQMAWVEHRSGRPLVVMFSLAENRVLRETAPPADGPFTMRNLSWSDDRTLLIELSMTDTRRTRLSGPSMVEYSRVIAVDAAGGGARVLMMDDRIRRYSARTNLLRAHTGRPGVVIMSSWDFLETGYTQETGSRLVGGRKDSGVTHSLFEVDVATGGARRLHAGTPFTQSWIVDGAGGAVALTEWDAARAEYRVKARRGGSFKVIYESSDPEALRPVMLTAEGDALVAIGARDGARVRAWRMPLQGGEITAISEDAEDVEFAVADRFTGALAGLQLGGLEPTVRWLDPKLERMQQSVNAAFPGKQVAVYNRSVDYRRLVTRVESAGSPPVYYFVDLDKGTADIVGESYPELERVRLGMREATSYPARDGLEIPAYLTLPPGWDRKSRLPLVLFPHGGPRSRDDSGFDWWAQFMATRGYAVLQPQFRGSTGFGADVTRAGTRAWGKGMQDDLTDGVAAMIERGVADADRVCIVGASYGGYAALAGVTLTPDLYRCAASVNGIADLPAMLGYLKNAYGEESHTLDAWERLVGHRYDHQLADTSPARQADRIRAAVLVMHAGEDTIVPIAQAQIMVEALRAHKVTHEYVEIDGEDHWLSTARGRQVVLAKLESFLADHLSGAAKADSSIQAP